MNIGKTMLLPLLVMTSLHGKSQDKPAPVPGAAKMNAFISSLMQKMTISEEIGQLNLVTSDMDQTGPFVRDNYKQDIRNGNIGGIFNAYTPAFVRQLQDMAVKETRLHIPLIFGYDVIHGHKTIFPIPLGLSCTWDTDLIRQSAHIAAVEAGADGLNWTFSPMVDISRDPRWGRISEGAGEDPFYGAQVAKAMVEGYQGNGLGKVGTIMACVKHFALYGAVEAGRDYNTVDMSRLRMYSTYFPPYKAAVAAGAGSVMSSFNEVDGIPATGNRWLMTDILRKEWGFKGFVVTDYNAINEMVAHGMGDTAAMGALALKAGIDMDMMSSNFVEHLSALLKQGKVTLEEINTACRRVLEAKYKLGLFEDPYRYISEERAAREIMSPDKLEAARNIARQSLVLLKNAGSVLPLRTGSTLALIGPLADDHRDMIGSWSAAGDWKKSVSVLEGIRQAAGQGTKILYAKGADLVDDSSMLQLLNANGAEIHPDSRTPEQMVDEAVSVARQADVVIAVLGESEGMTGEASSRTDIGLLPNQELLLKALVATGKPVVLVLMNGHPLTLPWENEHAGAILESWFPGTEAGHAIADVLFGAYNPSGKLTVTFPRNVGQIPIYYNHKNTGRPFDGNNLTKYASRYIDAPNDPLYPFGYGLSYTHFTYSQLRLDKETYRAGEPIRVTVTLTNDGACDGTEIVQLYIRDMTGAVTRPVKELKGFRKVVLKKGQQQTVSFALGLDDLKYFDDNLHWICEPGNFRVMAGGNSRDVLETGFTLINHN
jgi:beta-glucosidase